MATTQNTYTANGSTTNFSFTFPYLNTADVKVKINGTDQNTTSYSLANATTVQMNTAPSNGATVMIFRDTNNDSKKATFYPGSAIKAEDLNNDFDQILYTAQEIDNNAMTTLGDDAMQGDLDLGSNKLTNVGTPTAGTDGVNKTYVDTNTWDTGAETYASGETWTGNNTTIATSGAIDARIDSKIDTAIEGDVLAGTDLSKSASSGQVTINHNVTGANSTVNNSNGNVLQDITVSAQGHVTSVGSTDLDSRYYTETELNAGQLDNRYYTETELNAGQLDNRYYTETELNAGQLDNRYYTETEVDASFYKLGSAAEIASGETWAAADNKIATTAAIDARITDLVDDVGGFVPIASETAFPTANPDVNNGAGTLVSIKEIGSTRTPSGGTVSISNGSGSNTVTITGCGSTALAAGYGVIVETTSTLHTYTFHRLTPKATEVTTVAGNITNINAVGNNTTNINTVAGNNTNINTVAGNNANVTTVAGISSNVTSVAGNSTNINAVNSNSSNINTVAGAVSNINTTAGSISNVNTVASNISSVNDFSDVYRISSSDPSSHLHTGDLVFNTTANELKVYNGSSWQGGVTATGDLLAKSGGQMTGNLTFSGSQTVDGRDVSADGTKLDGIESNSTADMTGAEIKSAYEGESNTNAYTDAEKTKLSGIATSADQNVQSDWNASSGDAVILNKPTIPSAYTHPNHSGEVTSTGDGATVIADNVVDEANLKINNSGSNGQFLSKAGSGGGLVWDNIPSTSPGGNNTTIQYNDNGSFAGLASLLANSPANFDIKFSKAGGGSVYWDYSEAEFKFEDNVPAIFGDGNDLEIKHDTSQAANYITSTNRDLHIQTGTNGNETGIRVYNNGKVDLSYDGSVKFETTSGGVNITGALNVNGSALASGLSSDAQYNTVGGTNAGSSFSGTSANNNTLIGYDAGQDITTGDDNVFIGYKTGYYVTTGYANVAIGKETFRGGVAVGGGSNNVMLGYAAGYQTGNGHYNTLIGSEAGFIREGNSNGTMVGYRAGYNSNSNDTTLLGKQAGYNDDGAYNIYVGTDCAKGQGSGNYNIAIGYQALHYAWGGTRNGANNIGIGKFCFQYMLSSGYENICMGTETGVAMTTGNHNLSIGLKAGREITGGYANVFLGKWAGQKNTAGYNNIAIGESAYGTGSNNKSGYNNIVIGKSAGNSASTAHNNILMGSESSDQLTTGHNNISLGNRTGKSITTGENNIYIGEEAGYGAGTSNTSNNNVGIGKEAGAYISSGSTNTLVGFKAGRNVSTGSNNLLLGKIAGQSESPSGTVTTGSNIICLGNDYITDFYCNDTSISSSDKRDKTDVTDFTHGLKWIEQLKPVTYRWDKRTWYDDKTPDGSKKNARQHIGFLAQDVLAIEQADGFASKKDDMLVVNLNEDGTAYGLKYERLVPVLVNAVKELSAKVKALEAK